MDEAKFIVLGGNFLRMFMQAINKSYRREIWLIALIFLWAAIISEAEAGLFRLTDSPLQISADEMQFDSRSGQYVASGNVVVVQDLFRLSADILRYDQHHKKIHAVGNVIIKTGTDKLQGSQMILDLEHETGYIDDGLMYLYDPRFVITGKKFEKTGALTYQANNVGITACEGESPAWRITAAHLDLTVEGYAIARHSAFYIKNIPVLYTPIFIFPIKLQRQSGLLAPRMGRSSRLGSHINLPFYWAIDQHSDATFYFHYLEKRGSKPGLEYRYQLRQQSQGTLMADYLYDARIDAGTADWGYHDDPWPRTNRNRYWIRMKHDQTLFGGLKAQADLDTVSDQDYLMEFSSGYNGFEETRTLFERDFVREIDDKESYIRTSRLNINRNWNVYTLNTGVKWYDNIIDRRWEEQDDTLNQLPYFRINSAKHPVFDSSLLFAANLSLERLYSKHDERWGRLELSPALSLPLQWKNYGTLTSSVELTERMWFPERTADKDISWNHRETWLFSLNASTVLFRNFPSRISGVDSMVHTIQPELIFTYGSSLKEQDYPVIDLSDQHQDKQQLKIVLEQGLRFKERITENTDKHSGQWGKSRLRFKLEQGLDFNAEQDTGSNTSERLTPLMLELETIAADNAALIVDADWSHKTGKFLTGNILLRLLTTRGDSLITSYRYTESLTETLSADLKINLTDRITLQGDYEANLESYHEIRRSAGIIYHADCWSVDVFFTKEDNDRKYEFGFTLKGLGGVSASR